jgi:hypothetical protein
MNASLSPPTPPHLIIRFLVLTGFYSDVYHPSILTSLSSLLWLRSPQCLCGDTSSYLWFLIPLIQQSNLLAVSLCCSADLIPYYTCLSESPLLLRQSLYYLIGTWNAQFSIFHEPLPSCILCSLHTNLPCRLWYLQPKILLYCSCWLLEYPLTLFILQEPIQLLSLDFSESILQHNLQLFKASIVHHITVYYQN